MKALDTALASFHVQRQAYYSGTFIGNHVHRTLKVKYTYNLQNNNGLDIPHFSPVTQKHYVTQSLMSHKSFAHQFCPKLNKSNLNFSGCSTCFTTVMQFMIKMLSLMSKLHSLVCYIPFFTHSSLYLFCIL